MISAKLLLDSLSPVGPRLTTFEVKFPRIVLPDFSTHRVFSKSGASTRAIPLSLQIRKAETDPFDPIYWGKKQKGMQAFEELSKEDIERSRMLWHKARNYMIEIAKEFDEIGLHKQVSGRILEPFQYITMIVSSTTWGNFFFQRDHKDAQPELQDLARKIKSALEQSTPKPLSVGEWHIPMLEDRDIIKQQMLQDGISPDLIDIMLRRVAMGRICRVSYNNHNGVRDYKSDLETYQKLIIGPKTGDPPHLSPTEHVALCTGTVLSYGNFKGFKQARQFLENEFQQSSNYGREA